MLPSEPAQVSFENASAKVAGSPVTESALPMKQLRTLRYFGCAYIERCEKRSEDRLDYVVDLSHWLEGTESITGAEGFTDPGELVIDALQYSPSRLLVWLNGGANDTRHHVYLRVSTSTGKVADFRFVVVTRQDASPEIVIETVGTQAELHFPQRPLRRLHLTGNQLDRQDKNEADTLDYWLDLTRFLEGNESITAARAWTDNVELAIPTLQFDDAWLVVWLSGGGFEAQSNVRIRITTSRGRIITYRMLLVSHGQQQTPEYIAGKKALPAEIPATRTRELFFAGGLQHRCKKSEEVLDYVLNMSRWLEPYESITLAEVWTNPSSLKATGLMFSDTRVVVWLTSGADGVRHIVQLRVTTDSGKIVVFRFMMVTSGDAVDVLVISVTQTTARIGQITPRQPQPPEPDPQPVAQVLPSSPAFSAAIVGEVSSTQVQVRNAGNDTMSLRGLHITGDFTFETDPVFSLSPGDSFPVIVHFRPTITGVRTGVFQVDTGAGLQTLAQLQATGLADTAFRRIVTSGNQFVKTNGTPVRLKTVNWFGAESENYTPHGTWGRAWRGIIDQIKAMGFNCIRLPFSGYLATNNPLVPGTAIDTTSNPDLVGLTALQVLDLFVDYCLQQQIYIVLDHHRRAAGAGADGSPIGTGYTLADWKASWAVMANRYKNKPNIVGADVHNEPHDLSWNVWAAYVEEVGNYIHTIAPDWIIFCEGVASDSAGGYWWGGALGGVATRPVQLTLPNRLAYSPHEYGQSVGNQTWLAYDGQSAPAGWPDNLYAVWKPHWGFIFEQNIAPIWVGEFGGKYGVNGTGQTGSTPHGELEKAWTRNLIKYLNGDFNGDGSSDLPAGKLGMSFSYWSLNPNSTDTGGLLMDDWQTVQTVKLTLINPLLQG